MNIHKDIENQLGGLQQSLQILNPFDESKQGRESTSQEIRKETEEKAETHYLARVPSAADADLGFANVSGHMAMLGVDLSVIGIKADRKDEQLEEDETWESYTNTTEWETDTEAEREESRTKQEHEELDRELAEAEEKKKKAGDFIPVAKLELEVRKNFFFKVLCHVTNQIVLSLMVILAVCWSESAETISTAFPFKQDDLFNITDNSNVTVDYIQMRFGHVMLTSHVWWTLMFFTILTWGALYILRYAWPYNMVCLYAWTFFLAFSIGSGTAYFCCDPLMIAPRGPWSPAANNNKLIPIPLSQFNKTAWGEKPHILNTVKLNETSGRIEFDKTDDDWTCALNTKFAVRRTTSVYISTAIELSCFLMLASVAKFVKTDISFMLQGGMGIIYMCFFWFILMWSMDVGFFDLNFFSFVFMIISCIWVLANMQRILEEAHPDKIVDAVVKIYADVIGIFVGALCLLKKKGE